KGRSDAAGGADPGEFAWRVLALLNLFRLSLGAVLLLTFLLVDPPRLVGDVDPGLAVRALVAMIAVGCLEMAFLHFRRPSIEMQTYLMFGADLALIIALVHASGGMASGIGGLVVVSVGAIAALVPARRAFFF